MQRTYQFIDFEQHGDIFCVSFQEPYIEDQQIDDVAAEIARLLDEDNCRKMILMLGPEEPDCLLSVFLAKLINLHRRLESIGGRLALAHASDRMRSIFRVAGIEKFFHFYPDKQSALQGLSKHP